MVQTNETIEIEKAGKAEEAERTERADEENYFEQASSWADDQYASAIVSRKQYQLAFFATMVLSALLTIAVGTLALNQHTQLVVVHEGDNGYAWVSTAEARQTVPANFARTESEIAHYVRARESYDPVLYPYQTQEVKGQSDDEVYAEYTLSQATTNPTAPIHALGSKGYRTIVVQSILPLDSESQNTRSHGGHINLVQVDFMAIDHLFGESKTLDTPYTALVSWRYRGVPNNPAELYSNWDDFTVTKYQVEPVNRAVS